jgi:hypothetical protein
MAVGRISGPLLSQNLFRDNVPLGFYNTSSSEAPVLYLDVTNGFVGIKKSSPNYQLDVSGTVNADVLRVPDTGAGTGIATIGNVIISSSTISTAVGSFTVKTSAGDNFTIDNSPTRITSPTQSSSTITGALVVTGGVGIGKNLNVGGITNITANVPSTTNTNGSLVVQGGVGITGDLNVGGVIFGSAFSATISVTSEKAKSIELTDITSSLVYPVMASTTTGYVSVYSNNNFKFQADTGVFSSPVISITSSTVSNSTNTGALLVAGGAGIGGTLYVGGIANVTNTSATTSTTTGALVVTGGVGIGGDLNVGGNIHATGNITADGNIQLGNNTATDTLIVDAVIDSDLIPKVNDQYNIGSQSSIWANAYFDKIYGKVLGSQAGPVTISPANNILEINADIKVNGSKPFGTAPVVTNILYVTMDGLDTNDGRAQDASRACRTIGAALRSPYYGPGTSIKVAPGHYFENNPLLLQPYTSIIGSDLRTTSIEPINKTQDLFHVQSGCYLAQMQFVNGRSGLLPGNYAPGYNRGAYAVAFPPQVGGTKIDVFHSPYVQNCTNQSGPWLVDGTYFVPNQTIQVPQAVGTGTWLANTTTIVVTISTGTITAGLSINPGQQNPGFFNARTLLLANKQFIQEQVVAYVNLTYPTFVYSQAKCYRDVGIIVENISYDSTFGGNEKTVESGLSYYNGVTSVIAGQETQTIAAINYINTLSQYIITNSVAPTVIAGTPQVINTVLIGGSIASASILANINTITNIINYGTSVAPTVYKSSGPDNSFLSAEVLMQANRTFIQKDTVSWISNNYPNFVYNTDLCYRDVGLIVDAVSQDILLGGNTKTIEAGLTYWKGGYAQILGQESTTTQAINHARDISLQIIANQTVTKQTAFSYNATKCSRDIGLIVDSLAFDLLYDGTSQSAFAGLQYWNQNGYTGDIQRELTTTSNAIVYLRNLAVGYATTSGGVTVANTVTNNFNTLLYVLNTGTAGVTDLIIPNGEASTSTSTIAAYNLLLANKASMQQATVNWVTSNNPNFVYNTATCYRDVGYIIDSVAFDLLHGGNRQSIMSGVYYYGFSTTSTAVPNEIPQVATAYRYIKDIVTKIIQSVPLSTNYQSTATQVTSYNVARTNEAKLILKNVDLITNIISYGPSQAPSHIPISLTANTNTYVVNAYNLLLANREFIKAEVIWHINFLYNNDVTQIKNTYFSNGSAAASAVTRNFGIINTIITEGPELAPPIYQGGGLFAITGINADDIKIAPTVSNITTVSGNTYSITLSAPTVGFGTNSTLYFGNTAVFPLLDSAVPAQWSQRRIDTIGSMGGSLVDGGVVSDRSPIASFVYDAFTQVNQGGRGIHIINNGYAQLVSVFTIFCSTAVEVDSGGIASITNSNSNFGDKCLIAKGYGKRNFSGTIYNPPYPTFVTNGQYYPNGYWPQNGQALIFVPDSANRPHIAQIMEVEPPVGYINTYGYPGFVTAAFNVGTLTTGSITISGIDTTDIAIGHAIHVRDQFGRSSDGNGVPYLTTGTVVTDVNYREITLNKAINQGGGDTTNPNYFTIYSCGNAYYTVLSSTVYDNPVPVGLSLIPGITGAEVIALNFINTLTSYVITNSPPPTSYSTVSQTTLNINGSGAISFITSSIGIMKTIISGGVGAAPTILTTGTIAPNAGNAISLITANIEYITQETLSYISYFYPGVEYSRVACARDIGLIVESLAHDLLFNGTSQSTFTGLQYWNQNGYTGDIGAELTTTTNAINYISSLAQKIVQNITTGTRYQSWVSQINNITTATSSEATTVADDFSIITGIITNGTAGVSDIIVPNSLTSSTNVNIWNAYRLLQANKTYLQAEGLAYVESTKTPGFVYNTSTCYRDVGYMIDSVSFDLLYGGNRQAVQSGVYYYSFSTSTAAVAVNEKPQVTAAYNYLKQIVPYIIKGVTTSTYQYDVAQVTNLSTGTNSEATTVQTLVSTITNIIQNGPTVVGAKTPIGLTRSSSASVINAATILEANIPFLKAELIGYIDSVYDLGFNRIKCARDVRLILQQIIYDLETGGNYNSVYSGLSYWSRAGTYHLVQLGENIRDPGLMPDGCSVNFHQRSYISASGYTFEYVGAGTNYGSLPQVGTADPVQGKEVIQLDSGKVFYTSTDQGGDFRIGPELVISQATGVLSGRTFTKSLFANLTPFILALEAGGG